MSGDEPASRLMLAPIIRSSTPFHASSLPGGYWYQWFVDAVLLANRMLTSDLRLAAPW